MNGRRILSLIAVGLFLLTVVPVALAAGEGSGGGVHFGPYLLEAGETVSGDLVVIGTATLESGATFDGDLTVFGPITVAEGAIIDGDLSVFGEVTLAGTITGDCTVAGAAVLDDSAIIEGDLSIAGPLSQAEGAIIEGDLSRNDEGGISVDVPYGGTFQVEGPTGRGIVWHMLWQVLQAGILLVISLLFALLVVSVWPKEVTVIGEAITSAAPVTFAAGLAVLATTGVAALLLALTICLSPIAFLLIAAVGIGAAVGWVALGTLIGHRLLDLLQLKRYASPVIASLLGTFFLTSFALLINLVSDCLFTIIVWPIAALGTGAVLVTRFGAEPYSGGAIFTREKVEKSAPPSTQG